MTTVRQEQVNSVIQRTLAEIILEEMEFPQGMLVTISRVDTSPSLEHADIYITVLPSDGSDQIIKQLQDNVFALQQELDHRVVLKFVPKIRFIADKDQETVEEINGLLDHLNNKQ